MRSSGGKPPEGPLFFKKAAKTPGGVQRRRHHPKLFAALFEKRAAPKNFCEIRHGLFQG
nr:hypothetical protein [uncultured Acidocella sp.]